jgi:hypothetical protein
MLAERVGGASDRILYAEHLEGSGAEIYQRACAMGLEGMSQAAGRALSLRAGGELDQGQVRQTRRVCAAPHAGAAPAIAVP